MVDFCEDCGSLMHAADDELRCSACGTRKPKDDSLVEEFVSTEKQADVGVIESTEAAAFEGKPTSTDVICDNCSHDVAWYTIKQTGAADEPPTRFFKCKECGYRWREYS